MNSKYKDFENEGLDVIAIDGNGKLAYASGMNMSDNYCDSCRCLMFAPDPDPTDWFRDDDKKAICTAVGKKIMGSLEFNELTNIRRPSFCPKIDKKVTGDENK